MNNTPLVKIQCLVYNHEKFLRDCLEGIVTQKTDFSFEALVHDDASTDGTVDIIREYEEKYPDIIKPIYQTENQFSKRDGTMTRTIHQALGEVKYIAMCEGDDYWTDPYKLQKQVDFLEKNEDYVICFHNVKVQDETKGGVLRKDNITRSVKETTSWKDLLQGNFMHSPAVMFRRECLNKFSPPSKGIFLGDYYLWLHLAQYGKIKKLDDCMAVYRVHQGGVFSLQDDLRRQEMIASTFINMIDSFQIKELEEVVRKKAYILTGELYSIHLAKNNPDKSAYYFEKMMVLDKAQMFQDFSSKQFMTKIPIKVIWGVLLTKIYNRLKSK